MSEDKPTKTFGIMGQLVGRALRKPQLCEDEGCPQSHTAHVCINDAFNQPDDLEMTELGRSYGTYSAFRAQGWTDEQMVDHGYADFRNIKPNYIANNVEAFRTMIEIWCAEARRMGFVITVEQVSDQPPAMGKHHDVVTVREVRAK